MSYLIIHMYTTPILRLVTLCILFTYNAQLCQAQHEWGTGTGIPCNNGSFTGRADDFFASPYDTDIEGFGVAVTGFDLGNLNASMAGVTATIELQPGPDAALMGDRVIAQGLGFGVSGDAIITITFSAPINFMMNSGAAWNAGEYTHFAVADSIRDLNMSLNLL